MSFKLIETVKAHIKANTKVPHPILISIAISAAITGITLAIYYMADTGMFGEDAAEAWNKAKTRSGGRTSGALD